jgi:hypothetical protein
MGYFIFLHNLQTFNEREHLEQFYAAFQIVLCCGRQWRFWAHCGGNQAEPEGRLSR